MAELAMKAYSTPSCKFKSVFRVDSALNLKGEFDLCDKQASSCLVGLSGKQFQTNLKLLMTPELVFDVLTRGNCYGLGLCLGYNFSSNHWSHLDIGACFAHRQHKASVKLAASSDKKKGDLKLAGRYQPSSVSLMLGAELVYHIFEKSAEFCFVSQKRLDEHRLFKLKLSSSGLICASLKHNISAYSSIVTAFGLQARNVSAITANDMTLSLGLVFGQDICSQ